MRRKRKSDPMEQIEEYGREIILLDPELFLSELTCCDELHRSMAEGILGLSGWDISDVFLAAMDRAGRGE